MSRHALKMVAVAVLSSTLTALVMYNVQVGRLKAPKLSLPSITMPKLVRVVIPLVLSAPFALLSCCCVLVYHAV